MKKSLIIRWVIILVVVLGWTLSIFPISDLDFMKEFKALSSKQIARYTSQAESPEFTALREKMAAVEDKTSDEYKKLQGELAELTRSYGNVTEVYPDILVKNYNDLMSRIDNLLAQKAMDGSELAEGATAASSGYQAISKAIAGDDKNAAINLTPYVIVPHATSNTNKTVLRYVRVRTAGKLKLGLDLQGGTEFVIGLKQIGDLPQGRDMSYVRDQVLEILRNRLNSSGVVEPEIKALTDSEISVNMPSIDEGDKDQIRRTLTDLARLEFYLVVPRARQEELIAKMNADPDFKLPEDVKQFKMLGEEKGVEYETTILLKRDPEDLTGEDVADAFATTDQYGRWAISLKFNDRGAAAFAKITGENVNRQLAIVLDNTVYSAPNIRQAINGGSAEISGSFTFEEARRLAGVIASGNMPASLSINSEFGTEPSLGADSIKSGMYAGVIGLALVIIFMLWYYRFAGVVAVIALAVNTMLVLGTMALVKATITMPGIAGMVLTIGMAVDANVLIYERIREELKKGKTLANAVSASYDSVFACIFDSNITTLATCFCLYKFGTGSVRGFAVTLAFGIIASMFTALFMTHAIFDLMIYKGWLKTLKMHSLRFLNNTKIDFFKLMRPALLLSITLVVLGIGTAVVRNSSICGIDFAGGTMLSYSCDGEAPDVESIRSYLAEKGHEGVKVGYRKGQSGNDELSITLQNLDNDAISSFNDDLDAKFPECDIKLLSTYQVGGSVGSSFAKSAILAALASFIAIIIYLAFRFSGFLYGIGAVTALIHDVIVAGGIFLLFNQGQLSLTVVAALMTIIGYSINDTIVIFDRIRELHKVNRNVPYRELTNMAINDTLSRTIITTVTTMLTAGSLLIFGGGVIFDFAIVMFYGLICGTYSTIFIATSIVAKWHK